MKQFIIFILVTICLLSSHSAFAVSNSEQEINYLIQAVEESGCTYHRNGDSHDSARAADHLRLKLRRGKKYADTAEHFIERLASKSSWTGKPYHMECTSGSRIEASIWLTRRLESYRKVTKVGN